jgi:hypothetical protein
MNQLLGDPDQLSFLAHEHYLLQHVTRNRFWCEIRDEPHASYRNAPQLEKNTDFYDKS